MTYVLKSNLKSMLWLALDKQEQSDKERGYTMPSMATEQIKDLLDAITKGESILVVNEIPKALDGAVIYRS